MRCSVRIPIGKSGKCETYCYEPLNDKGRCPVHGPQWQPILRDTGTEMLNVSGQTIDDRPIGDANTSHNQARSGDYNTEIVKCNLCNPPQSLRYDEVVQHDKEHHGRQWG